MAQRVLLVEDDPTLRRVIQDNLGSEGYQVDVAPDGARAVRQTHSAAPDLIVLDSRKSSRASVWARTTT